ncbi:hypothetical protein G7Y89_g6546 [Cudoniella acicularis]|uniref:Uncharacterized protein n=1 Tax=Cudoniella acicularis TaxID=354080 RepID=A0A8H4RMS4_9HELO|nr:hypothetical protein G7Y89_g6546 [Cudoniella acicularis]
MAHTPRPASGYNSAIRAQNYILPENGGTTQFVAGNTSQTSNTLPRDIPQPHLGNTAGYSHRSNRSNTVPSHTFDKTNAKRTGLQALAKRPRVDRAPKPGSRNKKTKLSLLTRAVRQKKRGFETQQVLEQQAVATVVEPNDQAKRTWKSATGNDGTRPSTEQAYTEYQASDSKDATSSQPATDIRIKLPLLMQDGVPRFSVVIPDTLLQKKLAHSLFHGNEGQVSTKFTTRAEEGAWGKNKEGKWGKPTLEEFFEEWRRNNVVIAEHQVPEVVDNGGFDAEKWYGEMIGMLESTVGLRKLGQVEEVGSKRGGGFKGIEDHASKKRRAA